jgi:hypothetical protein
MVGNQTVFRSKYGELLLSFPEEVFGLGQDARGDKKPWPNQRFYMGMFATDNEQLKELFRKHSGNEKNGGEAFWEEKPEDTLAVNLASGAVVVVNVEDPLTEDDLNKLSYLDRAKTHCNDKQIAKVCEHLTWMTDRFKIYGLPKTDPDMPINRIRARVVEYLGAIEDAKIWSADDDGRGNTE